MLEIITKGKVAQHLKKSSMPVRLSDILNITGTDTFLAGGHSLPGRDFLPCKIRLQRRHTGIDQQQAVVIMGHQREAFHHQMALAFKKVQEHLPQFIYSVFIHVSFLQNR